MRVMNRIRRVARSDEGAVFVHVGIAAFVLVSFNVFVLDYGMMWVSRRQAQNAADAGALAGAVARGYDDLDDTPHPVNSIPAQSATQVASANLIWAAAGQPVVSFNCPPGVPGRCTRVDVFRNGEAGSTPLPTLFGPILGVTTQGVKATATALTGNGNSTNCLRPIAFPDEWVEQTGPNDEFNAYNETTGVPLSNPDEYYAPTAFDQGMTILSHDLGERIIWTLDGPLNSPIRRGFVVGLTLPGPGTFREKLEGCSGQPVVLRQTLPVQTPPAGDTATGLNNIIAQDPGVTWDDGNQRMENSCAPACAPVSPRLIPVALFDPNRFQRGRATNNWTQPEVGCPTNAPCITVTNIIGFFVHGPFAGYGPHGHFLRAPGLSTATAPTFVDNASWLVTLSLIR
jgi:hypothetical protein